MISAAIPNLGIGILGVAIAFGLTVVTMAYAIGPISGAHLNPAVSLGLWMGGRFKARELPGYIIAQVLGGIAGAGILYVIATRDCHRVCGLHAAGGVRNQRLCRAFAGPVHTVGLRGH